MPGTVPAESASTGIKSEGASIKVMVRAQAIAWSRRRFLASATPALLLADQRTAPSERIRFLDATTEFEVSRLTAPSHRSLLPPPQCRIFSRRGGTSLLFSSDHGGSLQACLLDLKDWTFRTITAAKDLDPVSLCLTPDSRFLCFRDGQALFAVAPGSERFREVYRWPADSLPGEAIHTIPEGPSALLVESEVKLKAVHLVSGAARLIVENSDGVRDPMPRPRRAAVAYRTRKGGLALAYLDGTRNVLLKTPAGLVGPARWAPDGRTLLYLHSPEGAVKTSNLREIDPDTGEDRLLAATSQFAQFSPNGDASVFVGASASKAQPHVLLLLRSVRRELVLCEHKTSTAGDAAPVFSPDSQRIFFQSDRHGNPAIYFMAVERLVEKTDGQ